MKKSTAVPFAVGVVLGAALAVPLSLAISGSEPAAAAAAEPSARGPDRSRTSVLPMQPGKPPETEAGKSAPKKDLRGKKQDRRHHREKGVVEIVRDEEGLTVEERAEKFARDNPEEAARRAEMRRRRMAEAAEKANGRARFLDSLDETCFSADDWRVHSAYVETLAARNAARARVNAAVAEGGTGADEDLSACAELQRKLRAAEKDERRALLAATARSVGLGEDGVADFLSLIGEIDSATGRTGDF